MKHGFIGFGNIARAIHKGLESENCNSFMYLSKSNKYKNVKSTNSLEKLVQFSDIIWICIKPNILPEILEKLKKTNLKKKTIVSVVAGKKIDFLENYLGNHTSIVRIMPNLAIQYNESVTAFCANSKNKTIEKIKEEVNKMGIICEIDESKFDLFTALYGSGPAFLLEIINIFKLNSFELGLSENKINEMIIGLLKGSQKYLSNNLKSKTIDELIGKITSKGGTTEAGLKTFKENEIDKLINEVIISAKDKAKKLN